MISKETIENCKNRKEPAFKLLYECCASYVFSIIRRYVHQEVEHQDLMQDVFAQVFLNLDQFDEEKGLFKTWIRKITVNKCLQFHRSKGLSLEVVPIDSVIEPSERNSYSEDSLNRKELDHLFKKMPSGYKVVFLLFTVDEYSHEQIGRELDISPETSRSQLSRAKRWLKKQITSTKKNYNYGAI